MNNWQRVAGPWTALYPSSQRPKGHFICRSTDGYVYDIEVAPNPSLDLANAHIRLFRYKENSTSPEIIESIKWNTSSYSISEFTNVVSIGSDILFVVRLQSKTNPFPWFFRYYRWNPASGLTQWKNDDTVASNASPQALYATAAGNLIFIWDTGGVIRQQGWAYPNTTPVVLGDIFRPTNVAHTFYNLVELNGYLWWTHDNTTGNEVFRTTELVANSIVSYGTGVSSDIARGIFRLESTGRVYAVIVHTGGTSSIRRIPLSGTTLEFIRNTAFGTSHVITDGSSGWFTENNLYRRFFGEGSSDFENPTGSPPPMPSSRFSHGIGRSEILVGYSFQLAGGSSSGLWKLDLPSPSRLQTWPLGIIPQSVGMRVYRDPP